ncbi:hypothetical protein [Gloeocapsopsis dulcis]|uniref:hypothetical protein n=1 Tax=Gloeocapsopsis dulcis TaxID=2859516 RepID=UPI0018C7B3EF|nr:hypothetical protein [Gloeocapsopsis dulcis]WNN89968.1 hypothetical protein P0S91_02385 [Gloeocapsopsis dulcis]
MGKGLADEETPLALDATPAITDGTCTITEVERRLLKTPNLEGIVLRYGFFYGPGTWYAPEGDVANQVRQQQFEDAAIAPGQKLSYLCSNCADFASKHSMLERVYSTSGIKCDRLLCRLQNAIA